MKSFEQFLNDLAAKESGGKYETPPNEYGYIGKYQMGESALVDAGYYKKDDTPKKNDWKGEWTGKDGVKSLEDFLSNHTAQENAIREYYKKAWEYIVNAGLDKYVGQSIGGIKITESGLIAGYHLKGIGKDGDNPLKWGLKQYLESGGKKVGVDGFGTPITEYLQKFADYDVSEITKGVLGNIPHSNPTFYQENPYTYTIQPGDTLSKIAKKYKIPLDELIKANPWIKDPNLIYPGQKIKIPGYAEKARSNLREATRRIDPLVVDLDGDGIELTDIKDSTAMFDLSGCGFANKVYNLTQRRV